MPSVSPDIADIPDGFAHHSRRSPLTTPWEPIYYKRSSDAVILAVRLAEAHTNSRGLAHGGFITALADMGLSCGVKLDGKAAAADRKSFGRFSNQFERRKKSASAVMKPPWARPREFVCASASLTARMTASLLRL